MKVSITLILSAFLIIAYSAGAVNWGNENHKCPVCGKEDSYKVPVSYGSSVYESETKLQMIFWPKTDENSHYICKHCGFSSYMGDFIKFDSTKKEKVKEILNKEKPSLKFDSYTDCPILTRLDLEEKCYRQMDKDIYFWCEFYRIKAYFHEKNKDMVNTRRYRMKAIGLAEQMLDIERYKPIAKELLYIIASMYYYTGNFKDADENIKTSKTLVYSGIDMNTENASALNGYLMNLTEELMMMIDQKIK
jgi:hypothetical protein